MFLVEGWSDYIPIASCVYRREIWEQEFVVQTWPESVRLGANGPGGG